MKFSINLNKKSFSPFVLRKFQQRQQLAVNSSIMKFLISRKTNPAIFPFSHSLAKKNSICINIFQLNPEKRDELAREVKVLLILRLHLYSLYCVDYEIGFHEKRHHWIFIESSKLPMNNDSVLKSPFNFIRWFTTWDEGQDRFQPWFRAVLHHDLSFKRDWERISTRPNVKAPVSSEFDGSV